MHWTIWSPAGDANWESLGGLVLLKEAEHWGKLGISQCALCFPSADQDVSSQLLVPCIPNPHHDAMSKIISSNQTLV